MLGWAASVGSSLVLPGCGGSGGSPTGPRLAASAWATAENLFRNDPKWIGGDGAYSIDLGSGRVLRLFGDSFIANTAARDRRDSVMVRNAIAIQTGYNPITASIKFYWNVSGATPSSFFAAPTASTWYWPMDGLRIGNRLIVFLSEVASSSGGLGFQGVGWSAVAIENPDADPTQWSITKLTTEQLYGVGLGAAAIVSNGFLYGYSAGLLNPGATLLARWPVSALSGNSLVGAEWYAGSLGWLTAPRIVRSPVPVANINQSEFTVAATGTPTPYLVIQTVGFGSANLAFDTASALTGPYAGPRTFYTPPEASRPKILIYSAKMHPMLSSGGYDVVATYNTNSFDFSTLVSDMSLYFPRFVRAKWVS